MDQSGGQSTRQEPSFSYFDEEDYEEPERDTDYTAAYEDDDPDDDIFAHAAEDEGEEGEFTPTPDIPRHVVDVIAKHPALTQDPDPHWEELAQLEEDDEEAYDEESGDEGYDAGQARSQGGWPLGLIVLALVALLLMAAGGYGVVQERIAMQEKIRQLNAELASAANPEEMVHLLYAKRELETLNEEHSRTNESLTVENRRLTDMVAGLESQLEAQNLSQAPVQGKVAPKPAPAAPAAETRAAAAAKPAPAKPPATTPGPAAARPAAASPAGSAGGDWFVNFGSYSQSAAAESWARRLKPGAGRVVVTSADRDGASFYRVRIVDLADRAAAETVSRQLEAQYGLPKLWVGRE